ncbi:MAG TPA: SPFH domain-containing protein [Planctomycetaceae bacterium]|nr:SPFH domain-containing protein [Planctomycetaceae bacterium]
MLWPIRMVQQWERGGLMVNGKWKREVGPGIYWVIPWFMHVEERSMAEAICGTPRLDITLKDRSTLSFSASATVQVVDVSKAVCTVDTYQETIRELLAAVLAEKLAEVDADRLLPENRRRLIADLKRWVQVEAEPYGVEIKAVRFTSFLQNAKAHRLIIDQTSPTEW